MSPSAPRRYDIVLVTDCRFPGGTSASLAEEIAAQAAAGYTTGLLHVPGPMVAETRPFNAKIRRCVRAGMAELITGPDPVDARLLVLRHPAVFTQPPRFAPRIRADAKVLVVNQAPADASRDEPYYDVAAVAATVAECFGPGTVWAPIGPLVRAALLEALDATPAAAVDVLPQDWTNIVDVDHWAVERDGFVADRPVIGRHSRPQFQKWPDREEDLLAAYPATGEFVVKVLGGAGVPAEILGGVPAAWTVYGFDEVPVRDFLAGIDFFVYFHHPGWVESFGRTILEAVASGAVPIVAPHFRVLFGDACVYAEPAQVASTVRRLYGDPQAYTAQVRRGRDIVRERFSHQTHVRRVAALAGEPSRRPAPVPAAPAETRRILFLSSNGAGVGHLMRLLAMARRAAPDVQPLFFTMSSAVALVRDAGFPAEHLASRTSSGMPTNQWNPLFRHRFAQLVAEFAPRAVVFDGTWPYAGLVDAREDFPDLPFVWSRRAMWKAGTGADVLDRAAAFDLVLEPGELAASEDRGPTATAQGPVTRVDPITYLDRGELLDADEAKGQLGLNPGRPAALVALGAGNINDTSATTGMVVRRLLEVPGLQLCVTRSIIAAADQPPPEGVVAVSAYPLSRYYRAFDFAVSAAGYNSYHELVAFGVPTIFVPNTATATDDQLARARYAERAGLGLCVADGDELALTGALEVMLDPSRRAAMAARAEAAVPANGAAAAMAAVEVAAASPPRTRRATGAPPAPPGTRQPRGLRALPGVNRLVGALRLYWVRAVTLKLARRAQRRTRQRLRQARQVARRTGVLRGAAAAAGRVLGGPAGSAPLDGRVAGASVPVGRHLAGEQVPASVVLVVALDLDRGRLATLLQRVATEQALTMGFRPLLMTSTDAFDLLRGYGYLYEYVMPREDWALLHDPAGWPDYVQRRIGAVVADYRPARVVTVADGAGVAALAAGALQPGVP